ncbi:MAG: hypothetical protein J6P72_10115 [Firmicutes bacterium]|nr:hypothetical protein [Bacillota bacterium]
MLYVNQNEHPEIPYPNNVSDPASKGALSGNIKDAGCGLCALSMVVDRLTMSSLSLEDAVRYSVQEKANLKPGTDLKILAPYIAGLYGLEVAFSNDAWELARTLESGGCGIVHIGGDREGHIGTLSDVGHYVFALSYNGREFCLLDPAWRENKYQIPGRKGKIREDGLFLYTTALVLEEDTENRRPRYYLFRRKNS